MIQLIKMMAKFVAKRIDRSVYIGSTMNVSSTRVQSYFILGGLLTMFATFIGIEVTNAMLHWIRTGGDVYHPSGESIAVLGMTLAHHISVLFTRSKNLDQTTSLDTPIEEPLVEESSNEKM